MKNIIFTLKSHSITQSSDMTTYETNESDLTSDDAKIGDLKDDEKIVKPIQMEDFDKEVEATQNLDNEIHGSDKNHTDDENTKLFQKLELDTEEPVSASPEVTQDIDASVELQYDSEVNEESPEVTIDYSDVNNDPEKNKMESNDKTEADDNSMKIEKVNDEAEIIEKIDTLVNDDSGSACQESIDLNDSAIDKDHSEASIDPISTNHELEILGLKTDDQKLDELHQSSIENDEGKSLVDCIKSPDLFAPKVSNFEEFEEVKSPEILTFEDQEIEQKVVTPIIQETDMKTSGGCGRGVITDFKVAKTILDVKPLSVEIIIAERYGLFKECSGLCKGTVCF